MSGKIDELREIVAEVLEMEPSEIEDRVNFEQYGADSLRAIEILARIEKIYKVDIPQMELPEMRNLKAVHDIVASYAGWQD
jgi:acyl carrier protein